MQLLYAVLSLACLQRVTVLAGCGVAICFSGHFKAFSSSRLLRESIKANFVDTLRANVEFGCGSDVFAYLSQSEAANESTTVADFIQTFEVTRFVVAPPEDPIWVNDSALPPRPTKLEMSRLGQWPYADNPAEVIESARSQYRKIMRCYDLVLDHEARRGRYAWVLRARFDGGWYRPLPPVSAFRNDRVWIKNSDAYGGVQDLIFLAPRHLSDAAFGAAAWLFDNEAPRWWVQGLFWQHESFLWKAWYDCGIPFGRASIPMVLVRDNDVTDCLTNKPWTTPISMLGFLVNEEVAPGGTKLVEAIGRAETAACLRGLKFDTIRHRVEFQLEQKELLHYASVILSANSTRNVRALIAFCDDVGMTNELECQAVAEKLWRKENVPLNLQWKQHSNEQEAQWIVGELLAFNPRDRLNHNFSYVFDLVTEENSDPNSRILRNPSSQRLCIAPRLIAEVARAALCVYLSNYDLVLSISAAAALEWPNARKSKVCLETLHKAEQDIEALLDAHKLTNPTWGGLYAPSQIYFRGRQADSMQLGQGSAETVVAASC